MAKKIMQPKEDKNFGLETFNIVVQNYSAAPTYAEKLKHIRALKALYAVVMDMFIEDSMKLATSGNIFRSESDPVFPAKAPSTAAPAKPKVPGIIGSHTDNMDDIRAVIGMNKDNNKKAVIAAKKKNTATNKNLAEVNSLAKWDKAIEQHSKKKTTPILEGFWYSPHEKKLPMPVESKKAFAGKAEFLDLLGRAEKKAKVEHYKGWSNCRICGIKNGTTECVIDGARWPEGYKHYVVKHNVKPTEKFVDLLKARFPQFANTTIATR